LLTIWKYPIPITDYFEIEMPKGAKILSFQIQRDKPQIWALVDSFVEKEKRHFRLAGTGHNLELSILNTQYIGTALMLEDNLVWHLFEMREEVNRE